MKLRNEKGLIAAVRDAGPFAMAVMANPNVKETPVAISPQSRANNTNSTAALLSGDTNVVSAAAAVTAPSVETSSGDSNAVQGFSNSNQSSIPHADNSKVLSIDDALAKADAGDAYAQGVVAIYYGLGYKTDKDVAKGLSYALKSAAQKHPLGMYQVGALRELGVGMKKDKTQAHKLMSEAFDGLNIMSGDPYALYDLGYMALSGIGVDQNPKEAARLFKTSADLGYAPAQKMYALLLEKGVGVTQDLEESGKYKRAYQAQWSSPQ